MDRRGGNYVKSEELAWQNKWGGAFQSDAYDRPGTRVVLERQFARIGEALQLTPAVCVLDLGCGIGKLLAWLNAHLPSRCHGLDLSFQSTLSARREDPTLRLVVGDSEFLPYKDATFGRVVCNGAAHHFIELRPVLAEIYRVLAPGGRLVLYEPASTGFTNAVRTLVFWSKKFESPADLAHKEEFRGDLVRSALVEAGFTHCSLTWHDFLAYPLSGNYLRSPLSRSRAVMSYLSQLEDKLEHCSPFSHLREWFSWRVLVVATKPVDRPAAPRDA